jgi:hypothetical protein
MGTLRRPSARLLFRRSPQRSRLTPCTCLAQAHQVRPSQLELLPAPGARAGAGARRFLSRRKRTRECAARGGRLVPLRVIDAQGADRLQGCRVLNPLGNRGPTEAPRQVGDGPQEHLPHIHWAVPEAVAEPLQELDLGVDALGVAAGNPVIVGALRAQRAARATADPPAALLAGQTGTRGGHRSAGIGAAAGSGRVQVESRFV